MKRNIFNIILLLLSIIGHLLLINCLIFYSCNNSEVATSLGDILFTVIAFGLLMGAVHIANISASIVAIFVKFRGMSFICMGLTIIAFFTTWWSNNWMVTDAGTTMLDYPFFVVVWVLHLVVSVALCIIKFAKRL